ncbi:MAG: alpha/beta hydrolase, partial [Melioribacteraceae bacterium]
MKNKLFFTLAYFSILLTLFAQNNDYALKPNISYYEDSEIKLDSYINERCFLDVYYPTNVKNFATVVWFHGGGLTGGNKHVPEELQNKGIAVVAVNYRLSPKAKSPSYIIDAAAAVAWVFKHIEEFGGDNKLIFISGHSAGGYLATMIGLDKRWLNQFGINSKN